MPTPRLIQVGVGGWGLPWVGIASTSADWEVVAYVDQSEAALAAAAETWGLDRSLLHADLETAVAASEADGALVVVPPAAHMPVVRQALASGLHVLVEKPLAVTLDETRAMIAAAEEADRLLMVSQNYRFRRSAMTARQLLTDGFLGEVGYVQINFQQHPHWITEEGHHGFEGVPGFAKYRLLNDVSVHHFDLLRWITGLEPAKVFARGGNPPWSWYAGDAVIHATIEMSNGALASYLASWVTQGEETGFDGSWVVECERGQLIWTGNAITVRPTAPIDQLHHKGLLRRDGGYSEAELIDMDEEDRWYLLKDFARCVLSGEQPASSGADNLGTMGLTVGTMESIRTGADVDIRPWIAAAGA
jgi:predicted dehydrogenase